MKNIYNEGDYLDNNPSWHEQDSPWKANHIKNILQKNKIDFNSICEIGCGAGGILQSLSNEFPQNEFYGYEITKDAFDICKKKQTHKLKFTYGDLLEESNSDIFDILLVIDVVEHVEDCYNFLRKCKNKANYKVLHIPLDMNAQFITRMSPIMKLRSGVGHIHYFSKETAIATLEDTGYEIIDYFYTNGSMDLKSSFKAKVLNIPRRLFMAINKDFTSRFLGGYSLMVLAK